MLSMYSRTKRWRYSRNTSSMKPWNKEGALTRHMAQNSANGKQIKSSDLSALKFNGLSASKSGGLNASKSGGSRFTALSSALSVMATATLCV